jgi:hypothetical protein
MSVMPFVKPEPVDFARVQRDLASTFDDIRHAIAQARDVQDIHQVWLDLKQHEAELSKLTDHAAAKLEKFMEAM